MKALYYCFGILTGVVGVLWTTAQIPPPLPVIVPVEVTRVVTPLPPRACVGGSMFGNLDGQLFYCADHRYVWQPR